MTTPPPTSRAEQRRRTEARILDSATGLFLTAGYERTTIRAVASAAGVDAGLVMHYFGSKQELFRRVIDAAPVPGVSGAPEQAEEILAGLADRVGADNAVTSRDLRILVYQAAEPVSSPDADVVVRRRDVGLAVGWSLAERPMRPVGAVVIDVFAEDVSQVSPAGDKDPVGALAPGAGDPAFADRVRAAPGRAW